MAGPGVQEQGPALSSAPRGLALLLERGGARLVAEGREVGGARVADCEMAVRGRPRTVAECRGAVGAITRLAVVVPFDVVEAWVRRRLVGEHVGGWRIEQVRWDRSEGTGAWELVGRGEEGEVWLRGELVVRCDGGMRVWLRRGWLLGPPGVTLARSWAAVLRRLRGAGIAADGGELAIDAGAAALGGVFAAAGWRVPGRAAGARVWVTHEGVELRAGSGWPEGQAGWPEGQVGWPEGQVVHGWREGQAGWREGQVGWREGQAGWREGQVGWREGQAVRGWPEGQAGWPEGQVVDVLAEVRAGLRGPPDQRAAACERLRALAEELPGAEERLSRACVRALRFVDAEACAAALGEPTDAAGWWTRVALARGSADELLKMLGGLMGVCEAEGVRLARALVLARAPEGVVEARALLEAMATDGGSAAVLRALACVRAADASAKAVEVEAALTAALGEDGWRRREEASDLRGLVAEAVMRSGRSETAKAALLRRVLVGARRGRAGEREERRPGLRKSAQIVADFYAQDGRWRELVGLLERELGRLDEVSRGDALARLARLRHAIGGESDG
ncbi:MAG: hypothetical protein JNL82_11955 [Myxococcales bacterium]|nr:hypothetical protein [Myxococcales bacterium]